MTIVIFGLTISSAWGNGHATLWRGLCRALHQRGHHVRFFEKDVPYYAGHRDRPQPEGCVLTLYDEWSAVASDAARAADQADAVVVTSYCPDGRDASALSLASKAAVNPATSSSLRSKRAQALVSGSVEFSCRISPGGSPASAS